MPQSLHGVVQAQGFEPTLNALIAHAERQARLHQSIGDRPQWEYWVKRWFVLTKAVKQMDVCSDSDWISHWNQHLKCGQESALE